MADRPEYKILVNGMIRDKFYILGYLPEETWSGGKNWDDGDTLLNNILENKKGNKNYINNTLKKFEPDFSYIDIKGVLTNDPPMPPTIIDRAVAQPVNFKFKYVTGNSIIQGGGANPLVGGEISKYKSINEEIIMDNEGDLYFVAELIGENKKITMAHTLKLNKKNENSTGWELKGIEAKKLAIKHNRGKNHKFLILQPQPKNEKDIEKRKQEVDNKREVNGKTVTIAESWNSAKTDIEGLRNLTDNDRKKIAAVEAKRQAAKRIQARVRGVQGRARAAVLMREQEGKKKVEVQQGQEQQQQGQEQREGQSSSDQDDESDDDRGRGLEESSGSSDTSTTSNDHDIPRLDDDKTSVKIIRDDDVFFAVVVENHAQVVSDEENKKHKKHLQKLLADFPIDRYKSRYNTLTKQDVTCILFNSAGIQTTEDDVAQGADTGNNDSKNLADLKKLILSAEDIEDAKVPDSESSIIAQNMDGIFRYVLEERRRRGPFVLFSTNVEIKKHKDCVGGMSDKWEKAVLLYSNLEGKHYISLHDKKYSDSSSKFYAWNNEVTYKSFDNFSKKEVGDIVTDCLNKGKIFIPTKIWRFKKDNNPDDSRLVVENMTSRQPRFDLGDKDGNIINVRIDDKKYKLGGEIYNEWFRLGLETPSSHPNTKRVEKQDYVINPLEELEQQDLKNLERDAKNFSTILSTSNLGLHSGGGKKDSHAVTSSKAIAFLDKFKKRGEKITLNSTHINGIIFDHDDILEKLFNKDSVNNKENKEFMKVLSAYRDFLNSYIRYNTANYGSAEDESSRKVQVDRIMSENNIIDDFTTVYDDEIERFNTITKSAVGRRLLSPSAGILLSAGALDETTLRDLQQNTAEAREKVKSDLDTNADLYSWGDDTKKWEFIQNSKNKYTVPWGKDKTIELEKDKIYSYTSVNEDVEASYIKITDLNEMDGNLFISYVVYDIYDDDIEARHTDDRNNDVEWVIFRRIFLNKTLQKVEDDDSIKSKIEEADKKTAAPASATAAPIASATAAPIAAPIASATAAPATATTVASATAPEVLVAQAAAEAATAVSDVVQNISKTTPQPTTAGGSKKRNNNSRKIRYKSRKLNRSNKKVNNYTLKKI